MLVLIAAAPFEFAGLSGLERGSLRGVRWLARTEIGGDEAILVANGAGPRAAAAGIRGVLARYEASGLVSTGFAGALDPTLDVGQVLVADAVLYRERRYPGWLPPVRPATVRVGSFMTVSEIVRTARTKRELWARGCHAVDMESGAVAAVAAERGLPFCCIRAISDSARRDLPLDFQRALRRDGSLSAGSLLRQAVPRPRAWPGLLGLWRASRLAAQSLAEALGECDLQMT